MNPYPVRRFSVVVLLLAACMLFVLPCAAGSAFDPNGNGRADFDDIVRISEEL